MRKIRKGILDMVRNKETKQETTSPNLQSAVNKIIEHLTTTVFNHKEHRIDFALGLLQECQIKKLKNILGQNLFGKGRISHTKARDLLSKSSKTFRNSFRKTTWAYRCTQTVESDKIMDLDMVNKSAGKKGRKKTKPRVKKTKGKDTAHKPPIQEAGEKDSKKTRKGLGEKFIESVKEIEKELQMYIEKGVRWLDLH
jgi:hypothetical protein